MDRFTDTELLGIIVSLELARAFVRQADRVEPPAIFEVIEAKIRPALQVDDTTLDEVMADALGELRWVH